MNYVIIENALPSDLFSQVTEAVQQGPFDNGKDTAHGLAKMAKNNLQLSAAMHGALLDRVGLAIMSHPVVHAFAMPKLIGRPILNRYEEGMEYGMHSDAAYINDIRTDVSFTLFLEDPNSYGGGELVVNKASQQFAFKLPVGHMVVYPTGALHRVNPVTRGVRNAVVGWIQSRIQDPERREIIAKLNLVPNTLRNDEKYAPLATQTGECIQALIRMWGN